MIGVRFDVLWWRTSKEKTGETDRGVKLYGFEDIEIHALDVYDKVKGPSDASWCRRAMNTRGVAAVPMPSEPAKTRGFICLRRCLAALPLWPSRVDPSITFDRREHRDSNLFWSTALLFKLVGKQWARAGG